MKLRMETQTLEERTRCRLFSQRVIEAVAQYQYADAPMDDDEANDLAFDIIDRLRDRDPAIIMHVVTVVANDLLKTEPKLLAKLLGYLGLALDVELLDREQKWNR